jgi:hypothetical protein
VPSYARSEKYRKIPDAQINIEDAVVALARMVFHEKGAILMGGHPSISPLISMVASEFSWELDQENPSDISKAPKYIKIYQSEAFGEHVPESTLNLGYSNYVSIKWLAARNNEKFDPDKKGTQCKESLTYLRQKMLEENPDALICFGGMEGVEEEFKLFREKNPFKPVYLLKNTGGATYNLTIENNNSDFVKILSTESINIIENDKKLQVKPPINIYPYSLIMCDIVEEIIRMNG